MTHMMKGILAAVAAAGVLALTGITAMAGAQVTDHDQYPATPQAQLTPGCDWTGLLGVTFSVNGGPSEVELDALAPFGPDDVVTMAWTGVAPACVGSAVSLAIKDATEPVFDPTDNQVLVTYASTTLVDGPGSLSSTLPGLASFQHACNYQFDAVMGMPLTYVGPGGSFYNASLRGDSLATTLIDARNGTYTECLETTTTTAPETTTTTVATTTTFNETTTTLTVTAPPSTSVEGVAGVVAEREEGLGHGPRCRDSQAALTSAEVDYCQAARPSLASSQTLASTGGNLAVLTIGLILVGAGAALLVTARQWRLRRLSSTR